MASAASAWAYVACNAAISACLAGERHALDGLLATHAIKAAAVVFDRLVVFTAHGGGSPALQAPAPARPRSPLPALASGERPRQGTECMHTGVGEAARAGRGGRGGRAGFDWRGVGGWGGESRWSGLSYLPQPCCFWPWPAAALAGEPVG